MSRNSLRCTKKFTNAKLAAIACLAKRSLIRGGSTANPVTPTFGAPGTVPARYDGFSNEPGRCPAVPFCRSLQSIQIRVGAGIAPKILHSHARYFAGDGMNLWKNRF